MATPPSDDSRMLFKLLADGEWHPYEAIRDRLAATVPPGRALRKYEERIEYARRYKGDPDYDTDADEDTRIYYGSRSCAQIAITSWKGRGLMFYGEGPKKQIRIKPGFKSWGIEQMQDHENADVDPPQRGQDAPDEQGVTEVRGQAQHPAPERRTSLATALQGYEWLCPRCSALNRQNECTGCGVKLMETASAPDDDEQQWQSEQEFSPEPEPAQDEETAAMAVLSVPKELPTASQDGYGWTGGSAEDTECDICGELIRNRDKHAKWHADLDARIDGRDRPEMALFAESEIRDLFEDVVSNALDRFQVGLVDYLSTQFAQLETQIWRQQRTGNQKKWPR